MRTTINIAIFGCGYMGKSGARAVEWLTTAPDCSFEFRLTHLADWNDDAVRAAANLARSHRPTLHAGTADVEAAFETVMLEARDGTPLLIYDASPPAGRFQRLNAFRHYMDHAEFASLPIAFIGEKPICIDSGELERLQDFPKDIEFFCELIECTNPVFRAVRDYIDNERVTIESLKFWRAGASGIKHMIGTGRRAIQGGALLDKAPHDLSISFNLLRPLLRGFHVTSATIEYLIPMSLTSILDASNGERTEIDFNLPSVDWPADGETNVTVEWITDDRSIVGDYCFGWLGVTRSGTESRFQRYLDELGYSREYILRSHDTVKHDLNLLDSTETPGSVELSEARIGIVQCSDRTIVCNLLAKQHGENGAMDRDYVVFHNDGRPPEVIAVPTENLATVKEKEIAELFLRAASHLLDRSQRFAYDFDREVTIFTHSVLFVARDLAMTGLARRQPVVTEQIDRSWSLISSQFGSVAAHQR